jgi:hypothetical protein
MFRRPFSPEMWFSTSCIEGNGRVAEIEVAVMVINKSQRMTKFEA